jgi:hypothetical protein
MENNENFIKDFRGALARLLTCTNDQNAFYRPSLESQYQQRINHINYHPRNLNLSQKNRMYIDSPVFKRERQIETTFNRKVESMVENHPENHQNNENIELQASTLYRIASRKS